MIEKRSSPVKILEFFNQDAGSFEVIYEEHVSSINMMREAAPKA